MTVTDVSNDTSVLTVSPATLIFTASNWNTAQTVTVTGVDGCISPTAVREHVRRPSLAATANEVRQRSRVSRV